jgi:hypothetical protein
MKKLSIRRELGASKSHATLLVLFVPSVDRNQVSVDQGHWVDEALWMLGTYFGGATAFPKARGVWRDDSQGGELILDEPVIIQCYTSETTIRQRTSELKDFLNRMGRETNQGAVGLVIDGDYLEIAFPLEET